MKIATWNVNSVRARLAHLLQFIEAHKPDIVLLQEIKVVDALFPWDPLEDLGYNIKVMGQKSYNGVAILSKFPFDEVVYGLPAFDDDQARYIEAFTGGMRVASIYVPNGQEVGADKFFYKLRFLDALTRHASTLLGHHEALVMGGDFNIAPDDLDVYDVQKFEGRILASPKERSAFRKLCHLGLVDAARALHPLDPAFYTWWDYRQGSFQKNQGLRIDHFLMSPEAADRLHKIHVDLDIRALAQPSDHAPLLCSL